MSLVADRRPGRIRTSREFATDHGQQPTDGLQLDSRDQATLNPTHLGAGNADCPAYLDLSQSRYQPRLSQLFAQRDRDPPGTTPALVD